MQNFETSETFTSPRVKFSIEEGILEIEGRLIPEDPLSFFEMLDQTIERFEQSSGGKLKIRIYLYYYNTSSGKRLLHFLQKVDEMNGKNNSYEVEWVYEEGDEDTLEEGHDYKEQIKMEFNVVEVEG